MEKIQDVTRSFDGSGSGTISLRDMQISKSQKKILAPPLPNPGDAPELTSMISAGLTAW